MHDLQCHWTFAHVSSDQDEAGQDRTVINALEAMDDGALAGYQRDKVAVGQYFESLHLAQSVQLNMQDLLETVVRHGAQFHDTRHMDGPLLDNISLNLSRLLLNLLSIFRSFLDHSDSSISRALGSESGSLARWTELKSKLFDGSPDYRLFYKLRNYAQHVGVPPLSISFTDSATQDGIGLRLDMSRDKLLADYDGWGVHVRKDLECGPASIPLVPFLDQWSIAFRQLAILLLELKRAPAVPSATRLIGHRIRLGAPRSGAMCVVCLPDASPRTPALNLRLDWVPEQRAALLLKDDPFAQPESATGA